MQPFRMGRVGGVALAVVGFLFLTGLDGERVVARVNGKKILLAELLHRLPQKSVGQADESGKRRVPEAIVKQALEEIIHNRLVIQEAKARRIPGVTKEEFQKAFSQSPRVLSNLSSRAFQEDWVVGVLRDRLVEGRMEKVSVKEDELKKRFERLRNSLQPEVAVVRWIVVEKERETKRLIERLRSGGEFSDLARKVSIEPVSAKKGGRVGGAVRPNKIPKELSRVIFAPASKTGLVPQPIEVKTPVPFYGPAGWYIVTIDRIIRQGETTLEKWRPVVKHQIRKEKASQVLEEYLTERRRQAKIWIEKDLATLVSGPLSQGEEK